MTKTFDPESGGKTESLRRFLMGFFAERKVEAYYFRASERARFPYIVYELRHIGSIDDGDQSSRYVMEINAYTKGVISQLDNLLDFLEEAFNGLIHSEDFFVTVNLGYGRIDVAEDGDLKRKRILFDLIYWAKER